MLLVSSGTGSALLLLAPGHTQTEEPCYLFFSDAIKRPIHPASLSGYKEQHAFSSPIPDSG